MCIRDRIESARTTAMLFMILVGALVFANFINYTSMPADLKAFVERYEISPISVIVGIFIVIVVQIGLISPPVGMNMFVVKSMLPRISTGTIFRGVMPFVVAEIVLLGIIIAFPAISLIVPAMMKL